MVPTGQGRKVNIDRPIRPAGVHYPTATELDATSDRHIAASSHPFADSQVSGTTKLELTVDFGSPRRGAIGLLLAPTNTSNIVRKFRKRYMDPKIA